MIRRSTVFGRALGGALVLVSTLGWTVFETATKERTFEGGISVVQGRKLPDGKWELIDEFKGSGLNFHASVLELARGKEVDTKWVLNGKTAKGRPFTLRLARPAPMQADLKTGSVVLQLPVEVTLDGKTTQRVVSLSTEQSVTGPEGSISGRRMSIQNRSSPVVVVGALEGLSEGLVHLSERARRPGAVEQRSAMDGTSMIIHAEGTVTAVEQVQ